MKTRTKLAISTFSVLALAGALTGCGSDSAAPVTDVEKHPVESTDHHAGHIGHHDNGTADKVIVSHGKLNAGVKVTYKMPDTINPGDSIDVEVDLSAAAGAGGLTVEVRPEGLEVLAPKTAQTFDLSSKGNHTMPLSVYCAQAGRFYLHLHIARSSANGDNRLQVTSVPVQVGKAIGQLSNDKVDVDDKGERVLSMPAEETIIEDSEK